MSVRKLDPPMQCIACGRCAQYVIDGTSWCRIHAPIQPKESLCLASPPPA